LASLDGAKNVENAEKNGNCTAKGSQFLGVFATDIAQTGDFAPCRPLTRAANRHGHPRVAQLHRPATREKFP
jgi:hypothetical protein